MTFQPSAGRIDIRIAIFGLVLAAHALFVYALTGGLNWPAGRAREQAVEIKLITPTAPTAETAPTASVRPEPKRPPPPRAATAPEPMPFHPPQQAPAAAAPAAAPTAAPAAEPVLPRTADAAPALKPQPVRVPAVALARDCATPAYPRKSYRRNEQGTVTLALLVGADGRVLESRIAQSSGFPDLDDAALAALSLCKFKPGTLDGKAEPSWTALRYQWKIE